MTDREKLIEIIAEYQRDVFRKSARGLADHLIANGVTIQRWIPVTERLPSKDGIFLANRIICGGVSTMSVVGFARNGKKVHEYDLRKHKNVWYDYDSEVGYYPLTTVTHWMPLPEPHSGERKDDES